MIRSPAPLEAFYDANQGFASITRNSIVIAFEPPSGRSLQLR